MRPSIRRPSAALLRSRAPFSFATRRAFSYWAKAPAIWRIITLAGSAVLVRSSPELVRTRTPRAVSLGRSLGTVRHAQPSTSRLTCIAENVLPLPLTKPSAASAAAIARRLRFAPVLGDFLASRFASRTSSGLLSA